eukprot:Nitzschia sp. Nitz4//scaffold95_size97785//51784//53385//NITZ4_004669-RA/size97785-processed-gene-0.40-mRNA-1//-1//CDS//3329560478//3184//frame0
MLATTYQKLTDASWTLCGNGNEASDQVQELTKSKEGLPSWGPTHSLDSELSKEKTSTWWPLGRSQAASSAFETPPKPPSELKRSTGTDSTKSSSSSPKAVSPPVDTPSPSGWGPWGRCNEDTTLQDKPIIDFFDKMCNTGPDSPPRDAEPTLGICPMQPPAPSVHSQIRPSPSNCSAASAGNSVSTQTPADRRRERHRRKQQRAPAPLHEDIEVTPDEVLPTSNQRSAPVDSFTLDQSTALELERSISELTMRSSYGVATAKLSENRRMAYYAVGKHHRQSGRGGNRRCYFTGKLILGGAPFYAGCVQQGLRTLVVFCLPSALGLPNSGDQNTARDSGSVLANLEAGSVTRRISGGSNPRGRGPSILSRKVSRMSTGRPNAMDELSLSVGEEMDPNWGLDKDYLLSVLPTPKQDLLDEMARRFPQQFETLPVQVRTPVCWRLYVKFCFFSGLPIAEGEMHYKVRDVVADIFGEEVILSHEVMEAVNGQDSAEILRLPNIKTFRYLRKHYSQQSAKLPEEVFQRQSWEMVRPEV